MFFKNYDKPYTMVDLYINNNRYLEYIDSYNFYDIDVDKIFLFKKSDNEYIISYNDVNKVLIVPRQLKIKNFYNELNTFANYNRAMIIFNDDKEFFFLYTKIQALLLNIMIDMGVIRLPWFYILLLMIILKHH